ncbi:hypothetical protein GobsT_18810 [Gemmata obscuriglobus]|nr:multiheme c-type cytochrome [Gemmata obscuriglobus]QEG27127.1 hypothetical protein GobsT_18810 [Gemmata obscuriglobus]VTS03679.1 Uncharacterized protein OS=Singulisphaera acidiphila (strain ATCC BAA-1392 / DSM 18658 / VKM B-2454 / MOB10) GN=Sinac_4971 PE=4 SV=1: Cytochrome_C554 [Gemmata obscuriglobus UQM 2246]
MGDAPAGASRGSRFEHPLNYYRLTMNLSARTVLVTLVAAAVGLAVAVGAARAVKPDTVTVPKYEPVHPTSDAPTERRPVGAVGCMAAACHGAPAGELLNGRSGPDTWAASGSCWAAADPHTAAYSLLTDRPRRSVVVTAARIMAKYRPGVKATDDARCLACHTNPTLAELPATTEVVALREQGVSCEACHGNAGQWIQPHTGWTGDRAQVYRETGLKPLYDMGERAVTCAGCHVGAPADGSNPVRDMNHDMIAAGHPRLNFDFAEYQRRLPKHWHEKERTSGAAKLNESQVWYVGRLAHAETACRLLGSRAQRTEANDARTVWPEFAEFNCAACHHNLRAPEEDGGHWRKSAEYLDGRPIGSTPWQTIWPVTHAPGLPQPRRATSEVAALVRLMEGETGQTWPDGRPKVLRFAKAPDAKGLALATADALAAARREAAAGTKGPPPGLFPAGAPLVPEWDSAEQLFFGLAAREYARGAPAAGTVQKYRTGVDAFRARDWLKVKDVFTGLR